MRDLVKRAVDIAVAAGMLALGTPMLAAALAATRLESGAPSLFAQERVGRDGKPFHLLKIRTMRTSSGGSLVTVDGDSRITRVGRWLRATKIDELPQLWNVIRGDMSLVGPRPEVPRYTAIYPEPWRDVFSVRPGITDAASLTFRDEAQLLARATDPERAYREIVLPMKIALSLDGIRNPSIRRDLTILWRTAVSVFRIRDARRDAILAEASDRIERLNRSIEKS